jgi:putative transport protein
MTAVMRDLGVFLRAHPDLALFTVLAAGYYVGRLSYRGFTLGSVVGVLIVAVVIGQAGVVVAPDVKQVLFLLFLFSIGYRTGPQFFRGLRSDGLMQALLTVIVCVTALVVGVGVARLLGYEAGTTAGLIAGAMSESATIGTAADAITHLPIDQAVRTHLVNQIPVAFAVTYLVGVISVAWFLSQIGPRLMGVDLAAACAELEASLGGVSHREGQVSAWRQFERRAYVVGPAWDGRTVAQVEASFEPDRVFVRRIRRGEATVAPQPEYQVRLGDVVAIGARRAVLLEKGLALGTEVEDRALLDEPAETLDIIVTSASVDGRRVRELGADQAAHGVFLAQIRRNGLDIPILPETTVQRGDILRMVGAPSDVARAEKTLGYADRPTSATDMVAVGIAILIGGAIGVPALGIGGLEIGLSESVGVLLGGLVLGWLRSVRPFFGGVPEAALWIFESLGLTGFIAVVGLSAGPDFVAGLQASGLSLVGAALVTALTPHAVGVLVGYYVLKMHPGILLGVCAGAGTATPALAAIQEKAKSRIPTLGYGVSYAVGNVLLALWGTLVVMLQS